MSRRASTHEAELKARALLAELQAARGVDSVEAAGVIDNLVESLWRGGKATDPEARLMAERSLAIREKALGSDHLDVAKSLGIDIVS